MLGCILQAFVILNIEDKNLKKICLSLVFSMGSVYAAHWGYDKHNGPDMWAKIDPKFKLCSIGLKQSSVNIESKKTTKSKNELHLLLWHKLKRYCK